MKSSPSSNRPLTSGSRRNLASGRSAWGPSPGSGVQDEYIRNLQQQIYLLELESRYMYDLLPINLTIRIVKIFQADFLVIQKQESTWRGRSSRRSECRSTGSNAGSGSESIRSSFSHGQPGGNSSLETSPQQNFHGFTPWVESAVRRSWSRLLETHRANRAKQDW